MEIGKTAAAPAAEDVGAKVDALHAKIDDLMKRLEKAKNNQELSKVRVSGDLQALITERNKLVVARDSFPEGTRGRHRIETQISELDRQIQEQEQNDLNSHLAAVQRGADVGQPEGRVTSNHPTREEAEAAAAQPALDSGGGKTEAVSGQRSFDEKKMEPVKKAAAPNNGSGSAAGRYVEGIAAGPKQDYARAYHEWILNGREGAGPVVPDGLKEASAESARAMLDRFYPQTAAEKATQMALMETARTPKTRAAQIAQIQRLLDTMEPQIEQAREGNKKLSASEEAKLVARENLRDNLRNRLAELERASVDDARNQRALGDEKAASNQQPVAEGTTEPVKKLRRFQAADVQHLKPHLVKMVVRGEALAVNADGTIANREAVIRAGHADQLPDAGSSQEPEASSKELVAGSQGEEESGALRETGPGYGKADRGAEVERARQESETFAGHVDEALGTMDEDTQVPVGKTPAVLQALGARSLPMTITAGTIRKDINPLKHGVPEEVMKQLPSALVDPLMVFDASKGGNALVVMTPLEYNGKTLIAAVHLDQRAGRYEVNRVASAYGKDDDAVFSRWIKGGLLRYYDTQRSLKWFQTRGLQLPAVGTTTGSSPKILTERDVFKGEDSGNVVKEKEHGIETDTTDESAAERGIADKPDALAEAGAGQASGALGKTASGEIAKGGQGAEVSGAAGALGGRSERDANAAVANTDPANGKAVNPDVPAWRANPETRSETLARLKGVTATKLLGDASYTKPEEIVAALQPLADMPFEIAHVIVLDKNGKPVQPAEAWEGGVNEVRLNWAAVGRELVQGAQNGGDVAYITHHHPGNGDVGKEDVASTREFGKLAETAGLRFGGHLVLRPNGEWSQISADGDVNDSAPAGVRETKETFLDKPEHVRAFAQPLLDRGNGVVMVWLNTQLNPVGYSVGKLGDPGLAERFGADGAAANAVNGVLVTANNAYAQRAELKALAADAAVAQFRHNGETFEPLDAIDRKQSLADLEEWKDVARQLRKKGVLAEESQAKSESTGIVRETGPPDYKARQQDAEIAAKTEKERPGTIENVAKVVIAAADGPVVLPKGEAIAATVRTVKRMMDAAKSAFRRSGDEPGDKRPGFVARHLGQPHEFLRGVPGVSAPQIWNAMKLHQTMEALAKAQILEKWGIRMLDDSVVGQLRKIGYMTDARIAQLGQTLLKVPRLAEKLGVPWSRQTELFRAAEGVSKFDKSGKPQFGALLSEEHPENGWRVTPEEGEAQWNKLTPKEQRIVKMWDDTRQELRAKEGLDASLEGYMRHYHAAGSIQKFVDATKTPSMFAQKIAGFRKARKGAPDYDENFYRAVVKREMESYVEQEGNRWAMELEHMIGRAIVPVKGQAVLYGNDVEGNPDRWMFEGADPRHPGMFALRKSGEQATWLPDDQMPLVRVAAGETVRPGQLRDGEITMRRETGPFKGEMMAVDATTAHFFERFTPEKNPEYRTARTQFWWGNATPGTVTRKLLTIWKLNQISLEIPTATVVLAGHGGMYASNTIQHAFEALLATGGVPGKEGKKYGVDVRGLWKQVLNDLKAPLLAALPAGQKAVPSAMISGRGTMLTGVRLPHGDRGGFGGLLDELYGGKGDTVKRGLIPRATDTLAGMAGGAGAGALAGAAVGGPVGGVVGGLTGMIPGAWFGLYRFLERGLLPMEIITNTVKRSASLSAIQERDPDLIDKLIKGTASDEAKQELDRMFDSVRAVGGYYGEMPTALSNLNHGPLAFLNYAHIYAHSVVEKAVPSKDKGFRNWLAGALALSLMSYMIWELVEKYMKKKYGDPKLGEDIPEEDAPHRFKMKGRLYIGKDDKGNENYLRTAKYPYLNLHPFIKGAITDIKQHQFKEAPGEFSSLLHEGWTTSPLFHAAATALDYVPAGSVHKEKDQQWGEFARGFVPFHRMNEYRNETAQAAADKGAMYVLKPIGFCANIGTGLPPELRGVHPSSADERVVNKLTSEFVQKDPGFESLKNWFGIGIRTADPKEYALWQDEQQMKDLKGEVGAQARMKDEQVKFLAGATGKPETYLSGVYDAAAKEVSRTDRADLAKFHMLMLGPVKGQALSDKVVNFMWERIETGQSAEIKAELDQIRSRDLPSDVNRADAEVLLKRRFLDGLKSELAKSRPERTIQATWDAAQR